MVRLGESKRLQMVGNNAWTSKLGQYEDIEHNYLEGLEGSIYGEVSCVMKRRLIEQE
jgi:hypothetical protein